MPVYTAERPHYLSADAQARYLYASAYCQGKTVIDVGTGLGFGAEYLLRSGAKSVLGTDYSAESIALAAKLARPNLAFQTMEVQDLSKIKSKFDTVIFLEVLEHLPLAIVEPTIANLQRLLKPGGKLILSTPNGLRSRMLGNKLYNPYHVKEYVPLEVKQLLQPFFSKITFKGIDWENSKMKSAQSELRNYFTYRLSVVLGHYKIVRELLGLIPKSLKYLATHEDKLPKLSVSDFYLSNAYEACDSLFVICKKK